MTSKFLRLAPAFIVSGMLSSTLEAESIIDINEDAATMQRDHVLARGNAKRETPAFGANKSGDYYEGALSQQ